MSDQYSFQYPAPGANSVLEYQASGLPYVTQSTATSSAVTKVHFPFVTKFFTIKNNGASNLIVGFTAAGVAGSNRLTLPPSGSFTGEIRIMDLFVTSLGSSQYEIIAGLTQIPDKNFLILTGSHVGFSASQESKTLVFERGFGYPGLG